MGQAALVLLFFLTSLVTATAQNPVPLVDQPLVPDTVAPGGPAFTLSVNGTGFVSGATVDWNGAPLPTTFVSGSKLTAAVPAGNVAAAGTASITVVNPSPGGGSSNSAFLTIISPSPFPMFAEAPGSPLAVGYDPLAVVAGDFNGDGKLDLAVVIFGTNSVSILLGDGYGGFTTAPGSPVAVGTGPDALSVGDFNGDGFEDLVVANHDSDDVTILLGNGDGSFTQAPGSPTSVGTGPYALATGDFNRDGKLDFAVINQASNNVAILLGNGDGTFMPAAGSTPDVGAVPTSLAVGDFNGDGKLDLAVVNNGSSNVTILLGDGAGGFTQAPGSPINVQPGPQMLVTGDFNSDGKLDLAVTTNNGTGGDSVAIILGNGDGSFAPPANLFLATEVTQGIGIGDFEGNGKVDLAAPVNAGVAIFQGSGDGTFQISPSLALTTISPRSVAVGDFNGDGRLDLATTTFNAAGSTVVVLSQQAPAPIANLSNAFLTFGGQPVGTTSAPQSITLTNKGNSSLYLTAITTSGDFAVAASATTCSTSTPVGVGASCTIGVIFTPTTLGTLAGSLSITDDSNGTTGSAQTVSLSGTGANVGASVTPSFLTFPPENVNTSSAAQTVTLTNTGQNAVNISGISISSGFSQSNNCGASLAVASSCTFSVTFAPTVGGPISGSLSITDDAVGSPQTVSLAGRALDYAVASVPTSLTVTPGGTASYALQISSVGGFYGGVMLACLGAPSNSTCSVTPSSVSLNGTTAVSATLTVATKAPSVLGPLAPNPPSFPPAILWLVSAGLVGLAAALCRVPRQRSTRFAIATAFALFLASVALWTSCGGGAVSAPHVPTGGTPAGTYTVTVTGTSNNLSHSTTVMLTVK